MNDPGAQLALWLVGAALIVAVIAGFAVIALPVIVVAGLGYGTYKIIQYSSAVPAPPSSQPEIVPLPELPPTELFCIATMRRLLDRLRERGGRVPAYNIVFALDEAVAQLYEMERTRVPRYLSTRITDVPATLAILEKTFDRFLETFVDRLPPAALQDVDDYIKDSESESFEPKQGVVLADLIEQPGQYVLDICLPFFADEANPLDLFRELRLDVEQNAYEASGLPLDDPNRGKGRLILAPDYKGTGREIVHAYLKRTPLAAIFDRCVEFQIPDHIRFEHSHVIAGSGHGKTQLLQHLILNDLQSAAPPALVVIDSQGDMLAKLQRLAIFNPDDERSLAQRLVIIDAEDVAHPPALNMFNVTSARVAGYSLRDREQIEAGTIELFNYIFGALAAELTQKQGTAFAYVTRLMLSIPGASIHTLRQLMEDNAPSIEKSPFAAHIAALDPTSGAFFENQFYNRGAFGQTKQQIARRLYGVLQVPAFDRMFSSKVNKLDMFAAMQAGSVILINTAKALLKSEASALFGRYMIALTLHAAFERVAVADRERRPAFLIIDEAAEYFDDSLDSLLSQARKFRLGVLFAHQYLDQLTPALRASVAANTSIKLAGGVSDRDARALAADMRTTSDFIGSMGKHAKTTDFACYVRNLTSAAVQLTIPFGSVETAPTMTPEQHVRLLGQNRRRFAVRREDARPAAADPDSPAPAAAVPRDRDNSPGQSDDWRS